jgi:hypothetical protein
VIIWQPKCTEQANTWTWSEGLGFVCVWLRKQPVTFFVPVIVLRRRGPCRIFVQQCNFYTRGRTEIWLTDPRMERCYGRMDVSEWRVIVSTDP